jgi:hypothetical protein
VQGPNFTKGQPIAIPKVDRTGPITYGFGGRYQIVWSAEHGHDAVLQGNSVDGRGPATFTYFCVISH